MAVSPVSTLTRSSGTPKVSAAIMAKVVLVPVMSIEPIWTRRVPSGSTRQPAAAGSRPPPPQPWGLYREDDGGRPRDTPLGRSEARAAHPDEDPLPGMHCGVGAR